MNKERRRQHESDLYVRNARAQGFRSRAVFKLEEVDRRYRLLRPGYRVLDAGAAPGAWSQYTARRVAPGGCVVALDRAPMEPIPGVVVVCGDINDPGARDQCLSTLSSCDVVLSDLSPDLTGISMTDQARMEELLDSVLMLAFAVMSPGADLFVKVFEGSARSRCSVRLRAAFENVMVQKPAASRSRSSELYLLARGLKKTSGR